MIYTRGHCHWYIPSDVTWFHGEIPRLRTYTHSSFSLFSRASFLSIFRFISLSLSPLVLSVPSPSFFLFPSRFISFHFVLSHRPVYLHSSSLSPLVPPLLRLVSHSLLQLDEDNVRVTFAFGETPSFSTRTIV